MLYAIMKIRLDFACITREHVLTAMFGFSNEIENSFEAICFT